MAKKHVSRYLQIAILTAGLWVACQIGTTVMPSPYDVFPCSVEIGPFNFVIFFDQEYALKHGL